MKHLRKWFAFLPLLAVLYGPVQVLSQSSDTPTPVIVQDVPIYDAETVTVQVSWLDNLIDDGNNRVILITGILAALVIGVAIFDYLRAHGTAKTEEERRKALEGLTNRLIGALEDSNNRNAAERTLMATEMLPVKTVLELVEASARIIGDSTQSALLKALGGFLTDVTETDEGEDLSIKYGTSGGEPESSLQSLG